MKKNAKIGIVTVICILLLAVAMIYAIPKVRVTLFVNTYHELFENAFAAGQGFPHGDAVLFGYDYVNHWNGAHPMTEFIIMTYGSTYYGCYYSPDDVPLAFQNTDAELIESGQNLWKWTAEGDNHGETSRILAQWYFFKASF